MTEQQMSAIFLLAGIKVQRAYEIANRYWPDTETYADLRREYPWWLVMTEAGPIVIGWRKRVISIHWEDTEVRAVVTKDDVTKGQTMVHAWSYANAVKYLTEWNRQYQRVVYLRENPEPITEN